MTKNIFRFSIFLIISAAVFAVITPILSVNNFMYPVRIDSAYVRQQEIAYDKKYKTVKPDSIQVFIYSPVQLNINFTELSIVMDDSVVLKGWLALDTTKAQAPLLLILPDISEGAINYIPAMKQFTDRGFNVAVMNLRGQGNSGGDFYNPGYRSVLDVYSIVNQLKQLPSIDNVAILGSGTGAGIALKAISDSSIADVVIFQNLPISLNRFLHRLSVKEWGPMVKPFFPVVMRSYEKNTGIQLEDHNYLELIKSIYTPHMLVTANFFSKKDIDVTVLLYNASTYFKKRLFIDADTFLKPMGLSNGKKYYDKIATYINSSLPPKKKRSRFGKLAFESSLRTGNLQ